MSEKFNESLNRGDRHSKVRVFGDEPVVGVYYAGRCQSYTNHIMTDCNAYSKSLALSSCGVSVAVVILIADNVISKRECMQTKSGTSLSAGLLGSFSVEGWKNMIC